MSISSDGASQFTQDDVGVLAKAIEDHRALPVMPKNLDLEQAYQMQHQLTHLINGEQPFGLKAGLTSPGIQKHFGLSCGVIGSLYNKGKLNSGCQILAVPGVLFEFEIGVIIDANGNPKSVLPVIEVVFLKYSEAEDLTASNIIAANVGADRIICGETSAWEKRYESTNIIAKKDGKEVAKASISDSMGGVMSGSQWFVEEAAKHHFPIKEDMLLILGTCGAPIAADVGSYTVDYGDLGLVTVEVV